MNSLLIDEIHSAHMIVSVSNKNYEITDNGFFILQTTDWDIGYK